MHTGGVAKYLRVVMSVCAQRVRFVHALAHMGTCNPKP